ncbi:Putative metallo-hydrolase YycJ [Aquisphaera giovannonii]|uniref:Metallo-hydrolase YycJ n=1 Tax=Aquisphaera giovannonii TaxID=406548 RepID=A0A5B9WA17_9BACT|nr:MBL fold metallo-hydrolase [Aquisphaera giovannonii]QEH36700.1 Putative metallo-hydrolase YycJ [Aquisphaera giovannonii]
MVFQFAVLGSGSRGNSSLVAEAGGQGLLIDAGLGPRAMDQRLRSVDGDLSRVSSVLLSHTHGDHLDSGMLQAMLRRGIALYCHEGHRDELDHDQGFQDMDRVGLVRHFDDRPFLAPGGFRIEPIPLKHGGPTFGFRVESVPRRRARAISLGYLTDTGCWSDSMADVLTDVDILGVEFNHDVAMQRASGRSHALIARNLGDHGHLSNRQGADLLRSVLRRSGRDRVRHVVLLHLSQQCNRPELAIHEAREAVAESGRRILIHAARQSPAHPNLHVDTSKKAASATAPAAPRHLGRRGPAGGAQALLPGFFQDNP